MNTQNNTGGGGCVMNAILLAILAVLCFSVFGGALMAEAGTRQSPNFPNIPAPAPETLNIVPSVQTFAEPASSDCPDPSQPWAGWEDGVGGVLPPCWTREQQNAYMRSH